MSTPNDETLAAGHSVKIDTEQAVIIYLIPIVGARACNIIAEDENLINAGEIFLSTLDPNTSLWVTNPYDSELINFIVCKIDTTHSLKSSYEKLRFDVNKNQNYLVSITAEAQRNRATFCQHPILSIGKFTGRKEAIYQPETAESKVFSLVIQGVFEVHGRLLHPRDGLALWDVSGEIALEALSNEAIVLLIEQPKE